MRRTGKQSYGMGFTLSKESVNILSVQDNMSEYVDVAIKEKDIRERNPRLIIAKLNIEMKEHAKKIYELEQKRKEIEEIIKIKEEAQHDISS